MYKYRTQHCLYKGGNSEKLWSFKGEHPFLITLNAWKI